MGELLLLESVFGDPGRFRSSGLFERLKFFVEAGEFGSLFVKASLGGLVSFLQKPPALAQPIKPRGMLVS